MTFFARPVAGGGLGRGEKATLGGRVL